MRIATISIEKGHVAESVVIEVVKKDYKFLGRIVDPTEEIIMEAIKTNGNALKFVENPTNEMCLIAVKNDGEALRFIKNPTREMCLEAIKSHPMALEYVENQDEIICLEAVKRDGYTLRFVEDQTYNICFEAVRKYADALLFVNYDYLADIVNDFNIYFYENGGVGYAVSCFYGDYRFTELYNLECDKKDYKDIIDIILEINGEFKNCPNKKDYIKALEEIIRI